MSASCESNSLVGFDILCLHFFCLALIVGSCSLIFVSILLIPRGARVFAIEGLSRRTFVVHIGESTKTIKVFPFLFAIEQ